MNLLSNKLCIGISIIVILILIHVYIKILTIKRYRELDNKINDTINIFKSTSDLNEIFNKLLDNLLKILDYDAAITIFKDNKDFRIMSHRGYNEEAKLVNYFEFNDNCELVKSVIETGKPYYNYDLKEISHRQFIFKCQPILYHMRSLFIIPIVYKDEVYGAVVLQSYKRRAYSKVKRYSASSFVSQAALAIENARLFQQLKTMDEIKTDFLSTVSHELRTPLTSIIGFTEMVKRKFEGIIVEELDLQNKKTQNAVGKIRRNINIILSEGERLSNLINDLLDISRVEAGKIDLDMKEIYIEDVINQAIILTNPIIRDKGIQVIQSILEALPKVTGDKDKLIQVVINLISNAIKFTEEGCIVCTARKVEENIIVSVIDTGIGIREEDKKYVFEKFSQIGDTLTNKPKGTGLGLTICKHIVEQHGGNIWFESEIGKGTNFSFSIPI